MEHEKRALEQHLEKAGPGLLVKVCTPSYCKLSVKCCLRAHSRWSISRPKAAGLVPVMAASYWLMALMAGCDWLTLRLKFIHSGVAGELLPAPGPCLVKTCMAVSLSLRPRPTRQATGAALTRAYISSH